jgi:uncharacterized protein YkwD
MSHRVVASIVPIVPILLAACSGQGPQQIGAVPSWRSARASGTTAVAPVGGEAVPASHAKPQSPPSVTFTPASAPAARYNDPPPPVTHTPLSDAVIAATRDAASRAGLPAPTLDGRIFDACAELAALALEIEPDYRSIAFAMQHHGIIEANPQVLFLNTGGAAPDAVVQGLEPGLAELFRDRAASRLGVAVAGRGEAQVVAFALVTAGLSTLPVPRSVPAGDGVVIDAVIDHDYRDPQVFVTTDTGAVREVALEPGRRGGFVARLGCGGRHGRQQIEISASGAAGPVDLANFPVWCDAQPPRSMVVERSSDEAPVATDEAERRLLVSLNRDRAAAGLPALRWDGAVAQVARGYSEEMRRTHLVAHVSPTSGSAVDRVRAAGIKTGVVMENVARAYGIDEAHQALMNSPAHRANLMSAVATHVGIGLAFGELDAGRRELFLTQVFTRVPPVLDRVQALAAVRRKLGAARAVPDIAGLDRIAQRLADGLAAGKSADAAYQAIGDQVNGLGRLYQRVGRVISAVADLDRIDGAGLLGGEPVDELGLGIAQGPHPEIGDNAIWIVVLLANRRSH